LQGSGRASFADLCTGDDIVIIIIIIIIIDNQAVIGITGPNVGGGHDITGHGGTGRQADYAFGACDGVGVGEAKADGCADLRTRVDTERQAVKQAGTGGCLVGLGICAEADGARCVVIAHDARNTISEERADGCWYEVHWLHE